MKPVDSGRRTFVHRTHLPAPPEAVFPLLCPVREYDWIPTWDCDLIHTDSGTAEEGCVFRTAAPSGEGTMTWVVTRHEPPRHVEFACVATDGIVQRLLIDLVPRDGGTDLVWTREQTPTTEAAGRWLAAVRPEDVEARTALLFARLSHYVATGTMRADPA